MSKLCAGCKKKNCDGCFLRPGSFLSSGKGNLSPLPERFFCDSGEGMGIVFDAGTTTMAAILWDMEKGEPVSAVSCVNPGRMAGSDVISRIAYCMESTENRRHMQKSMIEQLDELAEALQKRVHADSSLQTPSCIKKAVIAGNTAMCQILAGISLSGLAAAPFRKEYHGCIIKTGHELGFSFLKEAEITILPSVEGYVGADALSVCIYVKHIQENLEKEKKQRNVLAVDIGTNGEILLLAKDKIYACSAAAGPALEGAAVSAGMGASSGAIREVRLGGSFPREDIFCRVTGETEPLGICGSGLVDALAVLKKTGALDETGSLLTLREAGKAGVRERICRRLSEESGRVRFLLTDREHPVFLTAEDIRQLQLSKGAIRAGVQMLLQRAGISREELNVVYLAGAFGSHIKEENAVEIGLLPDIALERIVNCGNCAAVGAAMALLSKRIREEMEALSEQICHVELAAEPGFQEAFLEALSLKRM